MGWGWGWGGDGGWEGGDFLRERMVGGLPSFFLSGRERESRPVLTYLLVLT